MFSEPTPRRFSRIFHPTDFSPESELAFGHALKLTLLSKGGLTIWHLEPPATEYLHWSQYPHVRSTLARWGLLPEGSTPIDVARLGIGVEKIDAIGEDVTSRLLEELTKRPADLMVLMTHQHSGLERLLHGAVAEPAARESGLPTLFIPSRSQGFIDMQTGDVRLRRIVVPVDHSPAPQQAVDCAAALARLCAVDALEGSVLHVGKGAAPKVKLPEQEGWNWRSLMRRGDVVEQIGQLVEDWEADLIVLATAGHQGILDALRGSTTERIVRTVSAPVLAVPVY